MIYLLYLSAILPTLDFSGDTIGYRTASIFNKEYLASLDWGDIPVDLENGEDINSERFGELYYPVAVGNSGQYEQRATVPNSYMEIEIDLILPKQEVYELQYLSAEIVNTYDVSANNFETGYWKIGSRASEYRPYLDITGEESIITEPVEDVFMGGSYPSTFVCEVSIDNSDESENALFEFRIVLVLAKTSEPDNPVRIISDKNYFIGGK